MNIIDTDSITVTPIITIFSNIELAILINDKHLNITKRYKPINTNALTKPHCSQKAANMKSVWFSGKKLSIVCVAFAAVLPKIPPEPKNNQSST